jgi:hypothetical protein
MFVIVVALGALAFPDAAAAAELLPIKFYKQFVVGKWHLVQIAICFLQGSDQLLCSSGV